MVRMIKDSFTLADALLGIETKKFPFDVIGDSPSGFTLADALLGIETCCWGA